MKKVLSVLLALCLLIGCLPLAASAKNIVEYPIASGTLTFDQDTGTIIDGSENLTGALEIPAEIDGAAVTCIGEGAFQNCSDLTAVTIPDSVTDIGELAFSYCSGLISIVIPDGVTSIGNLAFSSCSSLTTVTLLNGVTRISDFVFSSCSSLSSIVIPDSVTSIGESAFFGCSSLTAVTIPDTMTEIGDWAFAFCSSLTSIIIPDSVISIGKNTFSSCTELTEFVVGENNPKYTALEGALYSKNMTELIMCPPKKKGAFIIPDSVATIDENAFSGCSSVTSITIPNSVTSIDRGVFSGCSGMTSITIPSSITSIGICAFSGCSGLTSVAIPDSVTEIGRQAFSNCTGLTDFSLGENNPKYAVLEGALCSKEKNELIICPPGKAGTFIIPDSVTNIDEYAFSDCSKLTAVTIPDSVTRIGDFAFWNCLKLSSIIIPDSVTSIGRGVFSGCSDLTSVTIPDGVTKIGDGAFYGCTSLTAILIPSSVTSIGNQAFDGCNNLTIHGEAGSCAETYANENDIPFVAGTAPTPTPQPEKEARIISATIAGVTVEPSADLILNFLLPANTVINALPISFVISPKATLYTPNGETVTEDMTFDFTSPQTFKVMSEDHMNMTVYLISVEIEKPTPTPGPVTPVTPVEPAPTPAPGEPVVETATAPDGTVTATTTWDDGKQAVAVKTPEGQKTITVTTAAGEKVADVKLPAQPAKAKKFADVKNNGWYKSAVDSTTGYGLFSGTGNGKFSPNDGMTRAMLTTVLHNLSGKPEYGTGTGAFADVTGGKWYESPAEWAYKAGVTSGTSTTEFSPNQNITREQLVTMLYRYANLIGAGSKNRAPLTSFPDGVKVADYAKEAMEWAVAEGFISGRAQGGKNYAAPKGPATRAEVAAVLARFVEYLKK